MKVKRLERCELYIASLKYRAASRVRFLSDEEIRCVYAKINRQNDRWLYKDPDDVAVIGTTRFPAGTHIPEVISSGGGIVPPHFFGEKTGT